MKRECQFPQPKDVFNMGYFFSANKDSFLEKSYNLILRETNYDLFAGKIIRFPTVYMLLCRSLHISKDDAKQLLKEMERRGLIRVHPYQGISLKRFRRGGL